ncbi:MAG: site-2 protease family protein, partial [Chloroflexota bacterium]
LPEGEEKSQPIDSQPTFEIPPVFKNNHVKRADLEGQPTIVVDRIVRPTEYTINWIPFGGYVKMVGEEDPSDPGSFASKSKRVRFAVLVAGSLMNLIAAVVLFTLTSMAGEPQRAVGTLITQVLPDTPAANAGLQEGDVIVGADGVDFKYQGDLVEYVNEKKGSEITLQFERDHQVEAASLIPRENPPEGQGSMGVGIFYLAIAEILVKDVEPGSVAAEAGFQAGDIIVGADDVTFKYAGDLGKYQEDNQGKDIVIHLKRGETIVDAPVTVANNLAASEDILAPPEHQGSLGIGVDYNFDTTINYYSLSTAIGRGASQTFEHVSLIFYVPIALLQNALPAEAARPTGPIGIYQQTGSAVDAAVSLNWWFPVLWWMGALSVALAVTNLLPLPALDGGRILFVIIEAIRGKRVSPEKEGAIHFIGLALLLTLMIVISFYDVTNPLPTIDWANLF